MKKIVTAVLLMVFVMPLSFALPKAEAAFLEDQLAEAAGTGAAAQLQQILQMTDNLADREALLGTLAKSALERSGNTAAVNDITTMATQLLMQDQAVIKENLVKAVETAARSRVQQEVTTRLSGYQTEMAVLSSLLNNSNMLMPDAVKNSNAISSIMQGSPRTIDVIN
ncbi:hypothetical protein [Sporomusa termitida]|uniref:Uncharacterized protein n=1 Tax=Sporomusa termitida TaxID=2377 RepID=A0A517DU64_9FIRM|nr:hypothetical protein [Sporomusa termitida]QDR80900.1 hypothetical protein SPTER_22390 [Sporomusa termitida]